MLTVDDLEDQSEFFDASFTSLVARDLALSGKEFQGCTFTSCVFTAARFTRTLFIDCSFHSCELSNASFKSCTLREVGFTETKLLGIDWTAAATLARLAFRRSLLSLGNFSGLDLRRAVFEACVAHEVEFGHTNLAEAVFTKTDLQGSQFLHTDLTKCDLRGAFNYLISPRDNTLRGAKFSLPEALALLQGLDIVLEE